MLRIVTSAEFKPEKEYAFQVLLHEILGLEYIIDYQSTTSHILHLPNGTEIVLADHFKALANPTEFGNSFPMFLTGMQTEWSGLKSSVFDPFAASFFLLARLEETQPGILDQHGRFPAERSLALKYNFLHRPVVNEWAEWLWNLLLQNGWKYERKHRKHTMSISCDVDHPHLWWSLADRFKTIAGAIIKRKNVAESAYWLRNHLFQAKDPYDVFEEWLALFETNGIRAQFNFMGARASNSDCWYPIDHPIVKKLIHTLADRGHQIGFHPSYEAFDHQDLFNQELDSLRAISPIKVTAGRQHYLRFSNPQTWQVWAAAGLLEDSTLGYPEAEGFRCGICHDFPVFDIQQRKMLQLREKPLIAMDVTLAQYQKYTPDQAAIKLHQLRQTVEQYGGDFTLLWHNSSWNTPFWEPWKTVFTSNLV